MSMLEPGKGAGDLDAFAAAASAYVGGATPPAGLPDIAILTRLANEFFAAVPGQSIPASAGPSLGGVGASPLGAAGSALPHAAEAAKAPVSDLAHAPSVTSLTQTPPSPKQTRDVSVIDLGAFAALVDTTDASLPLNVDGGPSLSGIGTTPAIPAVVQSSSVPGHLPGATQSSIPPPPESNPPPQVLIDPSSGARSNQGNHAHFLDSLQIPFEAELKSILAPLAFEGRHGGALNAASTNSGLYFLSDMLSPTAGIGVPGAAAPSFDGGLALAHSGFDVQSIRRDFPILNETVNGRPLIWFDNAATTQKPKAVIDRLKYFYEHENSNIHRAAHELAARATDAYEGARKKVADFLGASSPDEIIFVRGATEGINLVAATFGQQHIGEGDEIVITNLEHHANIVPWQQLAFAKGAKLRVAPVDDSGTLLLDEFSKLLNSRTKLVAFTQVSNALGTITPAKTIIEMAHRVGARVLVDGAQSVSHMKVNVQDLDADFFVFSGHKLFAPTGIGAVYGKKDLLNSLPPYQTGGNMIQDVTFERSVFHKAPNRFEAGTGNIADAVGLGAAIDYVERIGLENIAKYEHALLAYATRRLGEIPNLRIIGTSPEKASVISLVMKGIASETVGAKLNRHGIAVRSGHHCAQPILRRFGQETTVRPSFAFYNTCGEIDVMIAALKDIQSEADLTHL